MEDVGAIDMDVDSLHFLGIDVAGDIGTLVDDQNGLARFLRLAGKDRTVQTGTDDQIIVFHFLHLLFPISIFRYSTNTKITKSIKTRATPRMSGCALIPL